MHRTSSCSWVRSIVEMFSANGVDVPDLFRTARIDPERLRHDSERFGVDEVSELWKVAVVKSGNPLLGVDRVAAQRYGSFDVVGYAMLASPDLRHALLELRRFMAVISDSTTFALISHPRGGAWLELGALGYTSPIPRQRYAYGMLAVISLCEWLTRASIQPTVVEFMFDRPPESSYYSEQFGCTVTFAQRTNRMLLSASAIDRVVPSGNAPMRAIHETVLEARLQEIGAHSITCRVTEEIVRRLHRGEPRREEIAAALALADRTLRRRLEEENSSFQKLLEDARREAAMKYLADGRYSMQQIADLVGFSDHCNFFRAYRRWTGESPGEHRRRVSRAEA